MYKNNLRQVTVLLYKLKRNFGRSLTVRKFVSVTQDVTTGKQTQVYTPYQIRKAIVLPYSQAKEFVYNLTYVAANKNFTYGALFDRTMSAIIIDKHDLPVSIVQEDDLVIDTVRYQLISVEETEGGTAYLIKAQALKTSDPL